MHFYYRGTQILAQNQNDRLKELRTYMLVESFNPEYFFQLVCISGYSAGVMFGYIRKDPVAVETNRIAVTKDFLFEQIKYNLGEIEMQTYKVIEK
jgi:hypothetical protein